MNETENMKPDRKTFREKTKDNAKRVRIIHDSIFTEEQLSEDIRFEDQDISRYEKK